MGGGLPLAKYYECGPQLFSKEERRKMEPNKTPRCLILCLVIVCTRQLEILVTTLNQFSKFFLKLQYYTILYPAVNMFLHNVFRVCLNGGGEPQIGEVKCGGSPHLSCNCDQIKMRDYMDKRDTPPKRVTSRTWGSPPPCKQTLCHHHLVISVSMKF